MKTLIASASALACKLPRRRPRPQPIELGDQGLVWAANDSAYSEVKAVA